MSIVCWAAYRQLESQIDTNKQNVDKNTFFSDYLRVFAFICDGIYELHTFWEFSTRLLCALRFKSSPLLEKIANISP